MLNDVQLWKAFAKLVHNESSTLPTVLIPVHPLNIRFAPVNFVQVLRTSFACANVNVVALQNISVAVVTPDISIVGKLTKLLQVSKALLALPVNTNLP